VGDLLIVFKALIAETQLRSVWQFGHNRRLTASSAADILRGMAMDGFLTFFARQIRAKAPANPVKAGSLA
jgi:hypothetical protein